MYLEEEGGGRFAHRSKKAMYLGGGDWNDKAISQGMQGVTGGWKRQGGDSTTRRVLLSNIHFILLVSRTEKEQLTVVLNHQACVDLLHSSHRKRIHGCVRFRDNVRMF